MIHSKIFEIDIRKKYLFVFEDSLSPQESQRLRDQIAEWIKSDDCPFLFLAGTELVTLTDNND